MLVLYTFFVKFNAYSKEGPVKNSFKLKIEKAERFRKF